ncbi:hypothetical protein BHE74_00030883 [Ensete ventricosum]|nr:hypothetical protein BHE74_00030883 [Ensete ventricosum]
MAERHVSGRTRLMMAERHVSGTIGLTIAKRHEITHGHVTHGQQTCVLLRASMRAHGFAPWPSRVVPVVLAAGSYGRLGLTLEGTRSEGWVTSISESLHSGIPSPKDARSRRDLEAMKSCHDITSAISEEALESIRECYSILEGYVLRAPSPEQRPYQPQPSEISISVDALEAGLHFPLYSTIVSGAPTNNKEESIAINRLRGILSLSHEIQDMTERWLVEVRLSPASRGTMDLNMLQKKSRMPGGKGAPTIREDDKGYYVLQMADWAPKDSSQRCGLGGRTVLPIALLDRVHDSSRLVTHMGNQASLLKAELEKLRSERNPEQLALARQRVDELEADNAKMKSELDESTGRMDEADKELNMLQEGLVESQRQLKEQKADRRKADDELLKLMRENESLKAVLSGKSISDYKQSVGFGWGLRRIGQVSYKYGYRVALARFQAWYPNLEIDNDPFTERPEDSSLPMETHQKFDDSVPPPPRGLTEGSVALGV